MSIEKIKFPPQDQVKKESPEFIEFTYDEKKMVKELLGTEEQIYKKVTASLAALDRKQTGSYEVGMPMFYKTLIEAGGRKISDEELKLCKTVIDYYVELIRERQEWQKEADDYLDKKNTSTTASAQAWADSEEERTGINPEDHNNL